jgi:hypothetical protein
MANAQNTKILVPRIEAHLLAYEVCLQELGAFHSQIGDHSDLDLEGSSRQVAAWFISGRVIGLLTPRAACQRGLGRLCDRG